jgi:hypothetical protein
MSGFDVDAFIGRFRSRAAAVRGRGIPPLEGEARRKYIAAAEEDHADYSLIADASWALEGGQLVLRLPLAGKD